MVTAENTNYPRETSLSIWSYIAVRHSRYPGEEEKPNAVKTGNRYRLAVRGSCSLPRWGRAGVGASGLASPGEFQAPQAPIPTFPQRGKEQNQIPVKESFAIASQRGSCSLPRWGRAGVGASGLANPGEFQAP